jgi:hypothetical protein
MTRPKTKKPISRKEREFSARQVEEYIERYHPEMKGAPIDISPCGTFASVREIQKPGQK